MVRRILGLIAVFSMLAGICWAEVNIGEKIRKGDYPKRLRRDDSFFGLHFDFHAGPDCNQIGKDLTPQMIGKILDEVKPDYIQVDCKGHPGYSSYPTKVGNQAPGFVKDTLALFREETAKRGVALYMHYSGVWDSRAVELHPEWARIKENNEPDDRITSVFGPYVDELMIPQLKELAGDYGVDGVWVDGECWAVERDYQPEVIEKFKAQTGIQTIPRKKEDPGWEKWSQFNREGFRNYLRHYTDEVHKAYPDFQICSNWAFTSFMPEPVSVNLDFISGDFSAQNSYNTGRYDGRCCVHQGKSWDLMAWSFNWADHTLYSTKSIKQLKREAAAILSLGGGFQAYFPQKRDGSFRMWQVKLMKEVAQFCRARQTYCHQAKPVPQIGVLFSKDSSYPLGTKLFDRATREHVALQGILFCLLDSQNVVDMLMEHHLADGKIDQYPLIVWPEWPTIEPSLKKVLVDYVKNGGNLLVLGPKSLRLFAEALGVEPVGEPQWRDNGLEANGWLAGIKSPFQQIKIKAPAKAYGRIYQNNDMTGNYDPAAVINTLGKGKIAATTIEFGERYFRAATFVARDFLYNLVHELFPDPIVKVTGSHYVDVTLNRLDDTLMVNLINTSGPHKNLEVYTFDDFPAIGPLKVSVKLDKKPKSVRLQPENIKMKTRFRDGILQCEIPRLEIHQIIVIEP